MTKDSLHLLNPRRLRQDALLMVLKVLFCDQRSGTIATPTHDMPTTDKMQARYRKREEDATAIASAQAKRDRKNAKRAKESNRTDAK